MRNRPFQIALLYSTVYIIAICFCFYGHYEKYLATVYLTGMAAILPLVILTMKIQRDTVFGGVISGKAAAKEGMKFVLWSALLLMIFQAIFFFSGYREYKIDFTRQLGENYYKEENKKIEIEKKYQGLLKQKEKKDSAYFVVMSELTTVGKQRDSLKTQSYVGKNQMSGKEMHEKIEMALIEITVFKELTGVFFRCVIVGLFSAFLSAMFIKKN